MRKGVCVHFRWVIHDTCREGINMHEFLGGSEMGWLKRAPCMEDNISLAPCSKVRFPTQEEIDSFNIDVDKFVGEMKEDLEVADKLRKEFKKGGASIGNVKCHRCGGQLSFRVSSYNKHIWMSCETKGCVRYAE